VALKRELDVVEALVKRGADIDGRNTRNATALMVLNETEGVPMANLVRMIDLGANPDAYRSGAGVTRSCFHLAIEFARWSAAAMLLVAGAQKTTLTGVGALK